MPLSGGGSMSTLCLVGRELCLFTTLDAGKLPAKQRPAFAALAVRRTAPFADPAFDAVWHADGTAAVWYWSRERAATLAADMPGRRKRFAAEALYIGHPEEQATQLLQLAAGVEGRVWKDSRLIASRWWPESPSLAQWREFLRGAGVVVAGDTTVAIPATLEPATSPWGQQPVGAGNLQLAGLDHHLPKVALGLSLLCLLAAGIELGGIARAQMDIWRAHSAATQLDAPLKRILAARDATDKAGSEIASLLALHGLRPTTSMMAELTRLMPDGEWQIKQWNQPTPDTLEVSLVSPSGNPEQLVAAWEASPMFESVTTELGSNNELVIKATVTSGGTRTAGVAP